MLTAKLGGIDFAGHAMCSGIGAPGAFGGSDTTVTCPAKPVTVLAKRFVFSSLQVLARYFPTTRALYPTLLRDHLQIKLTAK